MRRVGATVLAALAAAGVPRAATAGPDHEPPPAPSPDELGPPPPSIHQLELEAHRGEPPAIRVPPPPPTAVPVEGPRAIVYGYYPYWVADLASIRWSTLTHLAWFSIELDAQGAVTAAHGWPDRVTVDAAHAAGVRVDLTFTLFSGTDILALTRDPARRAATIATMIDRMEAGGADGISIDFEGLIDGTRDHFTTFVTELRAALTARGHQSAQISIAGPSVNWAGADGLPEFDLPALLQQVDVFFVMGYGYFYGGSTTAGPIGILDVDPTWRAATSWSMERTLAEFASEVGPDLRHKIVHGIPYYGREWITTDDTVASHASSHVGAVTYGASADDLAGGRTRRWDPGSGSPWYAWQVSGQWHQVWYDDAESLALKYRLIDDEGLGGAGIWALNYDKPRGELWDLLGTTFSQPRATPPGSRDAPLPIASFPFHDERTTVDAPGHWFNYYACAPTTPEYGREWVYRIDACQPGHLEAAVTDDNTTDVDVHLLDALDERACIARSDSMIAADLDPKTYYLVVDSYVKDLVPAEGPFALDVTFTPAPGTSCPVAPTCDGGDCDPPPDDTDTDAGGCCSTGGSTGSSPRSSLAPLALAALGSGVVRRRRRRVTAA
ncbi:MAG TPA: glycosyl hydrolase family 18 protein [Kofleriaceae bacterium]|nr:glycosyl hydrolase family 18 protein [Kofleriaceae bacterium]